MMTRATAEKQAAVARAGLLRVELEQRHEELQRLRHTNPVIHAAFTSAEQHGLSEHDALLCATVELAQVQARLIDEAITNMKPPVIVMADTIERQAVIRTAIALLRKTKESFKSRDVATAVELLERLL